MKNLKIKTVFLTIVLAITYSVQSQTNTAQYDVNKLKGMKSKAAYITLDQKEFGNTKTFQEDDVTYKLWYNSKTGQCIKTFSKNYYIARVENSSSCKGNASSNNSNNAFDINKLKRMKSKAAYTTLEQNNFGNSKTFQEGDVTYKLWYNSKTEQCVKTFSRNYYIVKVENSNNCKGKNTAIINTSSTNNTTVNTNTTSNTNTTINTTNNTSTTVNTNTANTSNNTNTTTVNTNTSSSDTKFTINKLKGMKSKAAYTTLAQNDFGNSKTFQEGNVTYKLWYNSKTGECVKTYSRNYYIIKIEKSTKCKSNNSSTDNKYNKQYKGMKSKAAYTSLAQNGFGNTKTFQEGNVTYKLWYNSKTDECIKTFSKSYYIAKVEISNSCK
ncbi:hypothetical protein [uncultured Lacinutrix sp.]|uniref:hypothetical protein n=1 Tax=uncultured Lacinutrix sp. TaxID=574032 RepID=UPI0026361797|nr:hypothetical protein [uncultured Lacinutrix sp.]